MDYIKKMDEIISEKKKKGLVGIRFCILPESDSSAKDYQGMARAFCMIEELRNKGVLKAATSQSL